MSHTPGPWKSWVYTFDRDGDIVYYTGGEACRTDIPLQEAEANARLIAAAPLLHSFVRKCAALSDEGNTARLTSAGAYEIFDYPKMAKEARQLLSQVDGAE